MAFCTRCKRSSHYRSQCSAKTFKGGQTRIGVRKTYGGYRKRSSGYQKKTRRY